MLHTSGHGDTSLLYNIRVFILVLLAPQLLQGCQEVSEWYQRTTVVFATPHGQVMVSEDRWIRAGYSSDEYIKANPGIPTGGLSLSLVGEAVHLELPGGGYIVALMDEANGSATAEGFSGIANLVAPNLRPTYQQAIQQIQALPDGTVVSVPQDRWPTFVILTGPPTAPKVELFDHFSGELAGSHGIRVVDYRIEKIGKTVPQIEFTDLFPCLGEDRSCFAYRRDLSATHPLKGVSNSYFVRDEI